MKSQAKETKNELSEQFRSAYENIPAELLQTIKNELMEELDWKQRTFYYRLDGFAPVKRIEKEYIKTVFRKYGFEVFN